MIASFKVAAANDALPARPSNSERRVRRLLAFFALSLLVGGCNSPPSRLATTFPVGPAAPGLAALQYYEVLDAVAAPPDGWRAEALKQSSRHVHQVWISPGGSTAFGVIKMQLPLPVGHDLALWGFLNEMRNSEGEATLLEKQWDETVPPDGALRFTARGGLYTIRTNLFTQGFTGWAIYAGTLTNKPVNEEELKLAESAREHARIGPTLETKPPDADQP